MRHASDPGRSPRHRRHATERGTDWHGIGKAWLTARRAIQWQHVKRIGQGAIAQRLRCAYQQIPRPIMGKTAGRGRPGGDHRLFSPWARAWRHAAFHQVFHNGGIAGGVAGGEQNFHHGARWISGDLPQRQPKPRAIRVQRQRHGAAKAGGTPRHRRAVGFRIGGQGDPAQRARLKPRGVKCALVQGFGFRCWPVGDKAPQQAAFAPIGHEHHRATIRRQRRYHITCAKPAQGAALHWHGLRFKGVEFHDMADLRRCHSRQAPHPGGTFAFAQQQAAPGGRAATCHTKYATRRPARATHATECACMQAAHLIAAFRHHPNATAALDTDQAGTLHGAGNLWPVPPIGKGHGGVEGRVAHRQHGARNTIFHARRSECCHHARIPAELRLGRRKVWGKRRKGRRVIGDAIAPLHQQIAPDAGAWRIIQALRQACLCER